MEKTLRSALEKIFGKDFASKVEFSAVPKGQSGDLALKFFQLTKELGKSPVDIAKDVAETCKKIPGISETEIAGPYLNIHFSSTEFFSSVFQTPLQSDLLKNKNIVLEFSGPNTNKPLHLGHMRNHALGLSVSNVLEACSAKVHRVNIINDRGVHICKSMLAYDRFGNGDTPEVSGKKSDHFVGDYYVRFEQESKKDESLKDEVQKMLIQWENGDANVRKLWKKMNDWTLSGHQETYARQGIHFEKAYSESDYYLAGKDLAEKGLAEKKFQKRDDGAIVINLEDEGLDEKVILRADGTSIYLTQDLAVAAARKKDFNPDELIYIVADEQNYHFKVLFLCLEKLGLLNRDECFHLGYGLVHLPDGRMKSREGTVVDADNLMDELKGLALTQIKERNADMDTKSQEKIAEQIQNAAWKFFLLSTSPKKGITFDKDKSIQFEGATGPYLQYAGVRMKSIFRKADFTPEKNPEKYAEFLGDAEKPLGVKIAEFPKVLSRSGETKNPTYVLTYLLELSQEWSSYYANNSILNAETEDLKNARLHLAHKVFEVLEKGLHILGIEIPERM